ncbi:unnamed protein product [Miscanthus lutarioriparius]|uniref:CCHC-type domain-containing protein n=1 Tax=Miscanthus lutarioriparius TaxID=422564 RepID=A0A811RTW7_9POAL|nr:unnamed protein product [Miscanthus lutarioriparius]
MARQQTHPPPRRGAQQDGGQGTENPEIAPFFIDPRYRKMTCYNCGEPGHFVGNCTKPKICFICGIAGHHMNACPAWKRHHPIAAYVGSSSLGLGFYHLEVPDVESTQWLNLTNCGVVRVKAGEISLAELELELELSKIYCKEWPWQIRELEKGNFLVRFPPHKRVADIKNYPSFNLRKDGVQVEVLEWLGDMKPYGELQEVWVLMNVKVAVRDYSKIPKERLFEFSKKPHIVGFTVEMEQNEGKGSRNDGGNDDRNDGGDDGKGGMDEEADDLYDTNTEKGLNPDNPTNSNPNQKTSSQKSSSSKGSRTVSGDVAMDQDQQLKALMESNNPKLLTAGMEMVAGGQKDIDVLLNPDVSTRKDNSSWQEPELYSPHRSCGKTTEIGSGGETAEKEKLAQRDLATKECSKLLKRMELEASEDEEEIVAKEEEEVFSLEESGILPKHIEELEDKCSGKGGAKKNQKRKTGWGTILRAPQPRRVPEDGRTVVEKAQDLKKAKNLEKGCQEQKKQNVFRFEKWWLEQPDFKELVVKIWNTPCAFTDPLDIWQFKVRLFRKKVKGWALNVNGEIRKMKQELLKEFEMLDVKLEKEGYSQRRKSG